MGTRKRPRLTKQHVDSFFAGPPRERGPSPFDAKYPRHTYRVRDETHRELVQIARERGVTLYGLVGYILRRFVQDYRAGRTDLPVEEYVTCKRVVGEVG